MVGAVLGLLAVGVLAPACQKQKSGTPAQTLTVMTHPGEDGVSGQEGVCHVTIYATGEWEAESSASWAILTDESGENAFESGSVFFVSLPCGNGRRGCGRGRGCPLFSLP